MHTYLNRKTKIKLSTVLVFFIVSFLLITIRLYIIQINQTDFFKDIAEKQYSTQINLTMPRACIYDRNNKPLAINKEITSAFILPHEMSNSEITLLFLKKHFNHTYQHMKKYPDKKFIWMHRNITPEMQKFIKKHKISDIHFINETQRFYPFEEFSQIIGLTDIDNIGISGIELQFNEQLGGSPSTLKIEKDARNDRLYFNQEIIKQGIEGKPIQLTLDAKLQFLANEEIKNAVEKFEAKSGCAIILNPTNGHILAMVNYPYANPNEEKNINLLKNNIISECYEFGSVIKIFSAIAALDEKVTTTDEIIDCEGKVTYINKFRIENWKHTEKIPFADVVKNSSNIGMAKVAQRLGRKQYDHFVKLGFTKPTNIEFPGERTGFITPPNKWSNSSPFVLSFGYEINATLMQLAQAFSTIANDGFFIKPTLLISTKLEAPKQLYKKETMDKAKVILESIGELHKIPGYRVMGKTGTARLAENGHYSKTRHIYSYGGIIEKDDFKRVIITFIKEPKATHLWASQVSAPIFKNIAEKTAIIYISENR